MGASAAVLAAMVLATALGSRRRGQTVGGAAAAGTLVVLALGYQTGQAGGELVYRQGAARAYVPSDTPSAATEPRHARSDD